MFEKNYLKQLYEIDKKLIEFKKERIKLLTYIKFKDIQKQGRFSLITSKNDLRKIDINLYKKSVTPKQFQDSIGVSVKMAEKYLSSEQIKDVVYYVSTNKLVVVKS
jgi:hypothetical protein